MMMTYDFAPLLRNTIGFDRLMNMVGDVVQQGSTLPSSYPPYNIEKLAEGEYLLTMAVAGFDRQDIDIEVEGNSLTVSGRIDEAPKTGEILHRGIASRAFQRHFTLADHVVVEKAELSKGLLHIGLKQVLPEALKPRKIAVVEGQERKRVIESAGSSSQANAQQASERASEPSSSLQA
ncbi:Hsp20 family protein [Entomobacter blattae]|uniref:Small heat shock protein IbpB n=1 Tax=Entomobacter blattae TaxID=2762277 RepID=A0A7H1NQU2_9PROT|nr:Hsp20 family protein [Entomobacter blattae]QNT78152.1 Small heat shock protein IbpB [Entomobacter blattae]